MTKRNKRARGSVRGPIDLSSGGGRNRRDEKRTAQLCVQVAQALSLSLANMRDERLLDLFLVEVTPAPDASRLAVRVDAPPDADLDALREALDQALPLLRSEVAASIHRKRVPHLVFEVFLRVAFDA